MADPLQHLAAAEAEATRVGGPPALQRVGLIGGGTMGRGIARATAGAGFPAVVHETDDRAWERNRALMEGTLERAVAKGRLPAGTRDRIRRGTLEEAADAGIVIEAVFEDLDTKRRVFAELDRLASPATILATNTSSLDPDRIADATARADRVIGSHFFSPAHVMRLVEVVVGKRTSPETLETVRRLAVALGKVPVAVGVCPGFVGNRMLYAFRRVADRLLLEGGLPETVDRALREFGFRMGPFQVADLAGLDIGHSARSLAGTTEAVADRLFAAGRLGQKTGRGFYRYQGRTAIPDPEVERIIAEESARAGVARRKLSAGEMVERCLGALVSEGRRVVAEGVARSEADVDLIWTLGYGFPRERGGPLFWAENRVHSSN